MCRNYVQIYIVALLKMSQNFKINSSILGLFMNYFAKIKNQNQKPRKQEAKVWNEYGACRRTARKFSYTFHVERYCNKATKRGPNCSLALSIVPAN